jgi:hypothetical protein
MTREQLAHWLNISVRHTYSLEADGCPRTILGGAVRFDALAVERYLAERTVCQQAVIRPHRNNRHHSENLPAVDNKQPGGISARVALTRALASSTEALAPLLAAQVRTAARRKQGKG